MLNSFNLIEGAGSAQSVATLNKTHYYSVFQDIIGVLTGEIGCFHGAFVTKNSLNLFFNLLAMHPFTFSRYRLHSGTFRFVMLASIPLLFSSCKSKIYEFDVKPRTIWPSDSVRVTYKVRGEAVLLVYDRKINKDTTYRQFTLGFPGQEGGRHLQVTILNEGDLDEVAFDGHFAADSLVASGIKNLARWGSGFGVGTVTNPGPYPLDIYHEGRKLHLGIGKADAKVLNGTAVRGAWALCAAISPAQRADSTHLNPRLNILITLKKQ
ncbi:hypothetical protein ACPPVU_12595 [Mucilaginibacter sp. McL0603]|uniref:hypothetical protein n=1 Tax=Mucilaginibacter sp. McL0603 TaxID=3415670 RepID=UPI003CF1E798